MPRITIKVTLTTPEKTIKDTYNAIFHPEENSIVYKDQDNTTTKINLNEKNSDEKTKNYLWNIYLTKIRKPKEL